MFQRHILVPFPLVGNFLRCDAFSHFHKVIRSCVIFIGILNCSSIAMAGTLPICGGNTWTQAQINLVCSSGGSLLVYVDDDYLQIKTDDLQDYYLPACAEHWGIFAQTSPSGYDRYQCLDAGGTVQVDPISVTYMDLIDPAWLVAHANFYFPYCASDFIYGGNGGRRPRCLTGDSGEIKVSSFIFYYLYGKFGGEEMQALSLDDFLILAPWIVWMFVVAFAVRMIVFVLIKR
jgi:hypothetical protein